MKYIHYFFAYTIFIIELILSIFVCIIPAGILRLFGAKKASKRLYEVIAHNLAIHVLFLLGVKVHIIGLENLPKDDSNIAFIANHQSLLDVPAIYGKFNYSPIAIAKIEVSKIPFVGNFARGLDTIFMDRKSPKSAMKAIHSATERLIAGGQCFIFPEGTRSKTGNLGEFKAGSFKMAMRANSTIVPLVIQGTRAALEDKKGWHRYQAYVQVLPSVSLNGLDKNEKIAAATKVSADIADAYSKLPAPKK